MPYATSNDGTRIHYHSSGRGPALLLHHGFAKSAEFWDRHVDELCSFARVTVLDARGHGRSDKPHDEAAYSLARRIEDVAAVVAAVGEGPPVLWGYSMGGRAAYGIMCHAPSLCSGFVIGGMHGLDEAPGRFDEQLAALGRGMDAFADLRGVGEQERERLRGEDPRALAACKKAVGEQRGLVPHLRRVGHAALVYAGSRDPQIERIRHTAGLIPSASLLELDGLGHAEAAEHRGEVVDAVRELLR